MTCADPQCRWSDSDRSTHTELHLMLANLTAVQARCTELLEENRRLKAAPRRPCPHEVAKAFLSRDE